MVIDPRDVNTLDFLICLLHRRQSSYSQFPPTIRVTLNELSSTKQCSNANLNMLLSPYNAIVGTDLYYSYNKYPIVHTLAQL